MSESTVVSLRAQDLSNVEATMAQASRARQDADPEPDVGGIAVDRLRSIIERYERLEEEVKALRGDQKDILQEAVSAGFDKKALKLVLAIRKQDPDEYEAIETQVDLYRRALGC